jgi:hypothetical protein
MKTTLKANFLKKGIVSNKESRNSKIFRKNTEPGSFKKGKMNKESR